MKRLILIMILMTQTALAQEVDAQAIASAIYYAEGDIKASRPYGVFYKGCEKDTPAYCRKICVNTVRNSYRRFIKQSGSNAKLEAFIAFLQRSYAPTKGATNDPTGLNKNWSRLVLYFLNNPKEVVHEV